MGYEDSLFNRIDKRLGNTERNEPEELSLAEKEVARQKEERKKTAEQKRLEEQKIEEERQKIEQEKEQQAQKETQEIKEFEEIFNEPSLEKLHTQALKFLGNAELNEKEFIDTFVTLYSIDEIEGDIKSIKEKEEEIKQKDTPEKARMKKIATVFEATMTAGITNYDWLGKKIKIHAPSKFDELKRGVDAIIEFDKDEAGNDYLALGIDITFRNLSSSLFEEKVNGILKDIDNDHLTQVKYFQKSDETEVEGLHVPKVVLSASFDTVKELAFLWSKLKDPAYKEKFKKHKIKYDIVEQIVSQCELLSSYAAEKNHPAIAKAYRDIIDILLYMSETEVPELKMLFGDTSQNKVSNQVEQVIKKYRKRTS